MTEHIDDGAQTPGRGTGRGRGRRRQPTGWRKVRQDLGFVLHGERRSVTVLCVLAVVAAVAETGLLTAIVQAVSAMSAGHDRLDVHLGDLRWRPAVLVVLVLALVLALVRAAASAAVAILGPKIVARGRARQRSLLLDAFMSSNWTTQSADKTGRFMQNFSASVNEASTPPLLMTQAVPAFITAVVLVLTALVLDPVVTGAVILLGVVVVLALRPISTRASAAAREDSRERESTAAQVSGMLASGAEILTLGAQHGSMRIADERIERTESYFARAQIGTRLVSAAAQSTIFVVAALALLTLHQLGLDIDYAVVGTIAILLLRTAGLAQQVQAATNIYRALHPFIEHLRTLIAGYEAHRRRFGDAPFPASHDLELRGVAYCYPGSSEPALHDCTARIPRGALVAVLGQSGSGKSTLIQLLLRLRPADRGSITIGGVPIASIEESEFTRSVAYVPQTAHLVPGTVADNIAFFRPSVSRDEAIAAARLAHVHEEILALPQGYDTPLDAHVDQLSGGQKQRLALARALVGRPRVLVLDEPTSALDAHNEELVVERLASLRGDCTIVMITHKPSSASACDMVFRVQRGTLTSLSSLPATPVSEVG